MPAKKPPVAPKKKTPQAFMEAYQELCGKFGYQLADTTDGKYYRIEVINGVVTATDLTD